MGLNGAITVALPAVPVALSPEEKFREYLASRSRTQRYTEQQRDLVRHVFERHNHFDADQLIDDLKKADLRVSRATVYRTLSKLVDAGLLRRLELGTRTYYEHDYGYPQHEHLVCERCGRIIEFQSPVLEAVIRDASSERQFQASGHTLIVRGTCVECNRAMGAKRRLDLI
jgi:Fur family transcriptional regulator, ferric uptake regulator